MNLQKEHQRLNLLNKIATLSKIKEDKSEKNIEWIGSDHVSYSVLHGISSDDGGVFAGGESREAISDETDSNTPLDDKVFSGD